VIGSKCRATALAGLNSQSLSSSFGAIVVLVAPAPLSEWPLERSWGLVQSFSSSFSSSEEFAQLRQGLDLWLVARWRLMSLSKMLVRLTQQPSPQAKIIFCEK
jgi:hypothetical protein